MKNFNVLVYGIVLAALILSACQGALPTVQPTGPQQEPAPAESQRQEALLVQVGGGFDSGGGPVVTENPFTVAWPAAEVGCTPQFETVGEPELFSNDNYWFAKVQWDFESIASANLVVTCDQVIYSAVVNYAVPTNTPAATATLSSTQTALPPTVAPTFTLTPAVTNTPTATATSALYTPKVTFDGTYYRWVNIVDATKADIVRLLSSNPRWGCTALNESMVTITLDNGVGPGGYVAIKVPAGTCAHVDNIFPFMWDAWISNAKQTGSTYTTMAGGDDLISGEVRRVCGRQESEIKKAFDADTITNSTLASALDEYQFTGIPGYSAQVPTQGTVYIWWVVDTRFVDFDHLMVDRVPDDWKDGDLLCSDYLTELPETEEVKVSP